MRKTKRTNRAGTQAFTLLEVMLAISIFGLLMLYASQFMRSEVQILQSVQRQNDVEQKARTAMMHIVDEVRSNNFKFYKSTSDSQGIYRYKNVTATDQKNETDSTCLIFVKLQTSSVIPPSAMIFFEKATGELWYQKVNGNRYLIADEITQLSIVGDSSLVKIDIRVGGKNRSQPYELLTWVRLN